ncbi:MAG: hypothetical protein EZS28_029568, partial [Streblomastix strix]
MNKIHFIEGDTDSAYWAVNGNLNEDFTQQFNAVISDREFYNENAKYFFPTIKLDVYDEKKILGLSIERQGTVIKAPICDGINYFEFLLITNVLNQCRNIESQYLEKWKPKV